MSSSGKTSSSIEARPARRTPAGPDPPGGLKAPFGQDGPHPGMGERILELPVQPRHHGLRRSHWGEHAIPGIDTKALEPAPRGREAPLPSDCLRPEAVVLAAQKRFWWHPKTTQRALGKEGPFLATGSQMNCGGCGCTDQRRGYFYAHPDEEAGKQHERAPCNENAFNASQAEHCTACCCAYGD